MFRHTSTSSATDQQNYMDGMFRHTSTSSATDQQLYKKGLNKKKALVSF